MAKKDIVNKKKVSDEAEIVSIETEVGMVKMSDDGKIVITTDSEFK